jgi:hypothetical protein
MALTINSALDLEVVVCQHHFAVHTREAPRVEFLVDRKSAIAVRRGGCLEVLSFNATVAARAQRSIGFVIVVLAVRLIVDDIEIRSSERLLAGTAGEALLVPSACKSAIGGFDGLSLDRLVATTADGSDTRSSGTTNGWHRAESMRLGWWGSGFQEFADR